SKFREIVELRQVGIRQTYVGASKIKTADRNADCASIDPDVLNRIHHIQENLDRFQEAEDLSREAGDSDFSISDELTDLRNDRYRIRQEIDNWLNGIKDLVNGV